MGKEVKSLDDLFGYKGREVTLETSDKSLVGKIGKIIKRKDCFYILSEEKEILEFNDNGEFISILNKLGAGPDEYTMITDFAIYINEKDEVEIWISDFKKIKKYHKISDLWEQFAQIDFPFVINKFHVVNNNCLLLLTGQNENCITISDENGNIFSSYLKSEIPFMIFKPVQFVNFEEKIVFQLGVSNNCVIYSSQHNKFTNSKIVDNNKFLSSKKLQELFSKYEYDYLRELSQYSYIRTLRRIKDLTLIEFFMNNKRHISICSDNEWRFFAYDPKEIINNNNFERLSTIGIGDNLTGFIMFENNKNVDQNPIIVEY